MRILSLNARNFRNIEVLALQPHARFNVLWGKNGQGKTNVLEAIYGVCALRSFRTSRFKEVIALGQESAHVKAVVESAGLESTYEVTQTQSSRRVRLNGKAVRPLKNYFGDFNVVLFSPEDLRIPRTSPGERRKFLDRAVFGADAAHLGVVQDYEKVMRNRNAVLKKARENGSDPTSMLTVYDEQLAGYGAEITAARLAYLEDMKETFAAAFASIVGQTLTPALTYQSTWCDTGQPPADWREATASIKAQLTADLKASRREDLIRATTSVGPHRDDLGFWLAGQPAASFASQGQTRALVLAWKSAEMRLLEQKHGRQPILLLDDVSSELDAEKNEQLFSLIESQSGQCFVTTTDPSYVRISAAHARFHVSGGSVRADDS